MCDHPGSCRRRSPTPTDEPHLFSDLKEFIPPEEFKYLDFNMVVNWLKHYKPEHEDPFFIPESEAASLILRAITKFIAVYRQFPPEPMDAFMEWLSIHRYPNPQPP